MNWLGEIIQNHVQYNDTVLDLGCGIMQATTDTIEKSNRQKVGRIKKIVSGNYKPNVLRCRSLLGCEIVEKYLHRAKKYYPVIKFDLTKTKSFDMFMDKSFDVVMALDVIEHIEYSQTLRIIGQMERIARKKIIIYTPSTWMKNEENVDNAWGMGENPFQEHKCFIPPSRFQDWGYKVRFPEQSNNTLAIKVIK